MSRFALVLAAAALAATPAVASAQQPRCEVLGGPHVEVHDGEPVIVLEPYQPVCYY